MSVSGIGSSNFYQNQFQTINTEFQQLGQALQAGNLSEAQQDYATLTQNTQNSTQNTNTNPIAQAFTALGQALQSGNLSNAQQAFTTLQQDVQQAGSQIAQTGHHHHHHHHGGGSGSSSSTSSSSSTDPFAQEMSVLGQALQAGNLTAAQQAYSAIQQAFQQFGAPSSGSPTTNPAVNVAA